LGKQQLFIVGIIESINTVQSLNKLVCLHKKADGIHTGTIQQSFPGNSSLMGRHAVPTGKQLPTLTTVYTSNQPDSVSLNLTVTLTQLTSQHYH